MNEAVAVAGWQSLPPRRWSRTEQNWGLTLVLLAGTIGIFYLIYAFEMYLGRWEGSIRLVRDPAQAAMRYLGITHFLIALLYMLTSRSMRGGWMRARFALLVVVGAMLCVGYARLQSALPQIAIALFIAYFLAHDFRDQFFFYAANGDAPPEGVKPLDVLRTPSLHRPLVVTLVGTLGLLLVSGALGWAGHAIVIAHVVSWYVFITRALTRPSPAPVSSSWRTDVKVFNVLHIGGCILLICLGIVWGYAFRNSPEHRIFWTLLDGKNFYYWTILHVTVSFAQFR